MRLSVLGKSALAIAALVAAAPMASAAVISSWNFEGLTLPNTAGSNPPAPTTGSYAADVGPGQITGVHAAATSVWSTPSGNGSTKSFSVNGWGLGDYWEFTSDTTGQSGIMLLVDATGSNTGPRDFQVQYSSTGNAGPYTNLPSGAYSLVNSAFSAGTEQFTTPPRFLFDLSGVAALDNNPSVAFRLTTTSTVSINAGTVASGGTSRIDNVIVGTNLAIPEPASAAFGLIAAAALIRRRK